MAAIYMWFKDRIILTTTLYPIEVADSLCFNITATGGVMELLPESEDTVNYTAIDGSYTQVRWFYSDGPYDSDDTLDYTAIDGTYIQTRWFFSDGPYDSDDTVSFTALDGTLINKLVTVDTPDESLQLDCVINNTCSMDLI